MPQADNATATRPQGAARLLRDLAPLLLAMGAGFLTIAILLPALPLHVSRLGFGTAVAGLSVGLQSIATILTRPQAGRMVDAYGPKNVLLAGLATASCAGLLTLASLAGLAPVPSLLVLLVGRLVLGVGESLLITGVLIWAIAIAGANRAGRAMAWNGMAQYSALALGAPAGFWLYGQHGFTAVASCTAILPLLGMAAVLPLAPARVASGGARLPLRHVVALVWGPGATLTLSAIGFAAISTFASLDFTRHGWPGAGNALFAYGACFVGVRFFGSGLPDRLGGARVATFSMAIEAVGQFLLWSAPLPAVALLGAALTGAGCSLVFPSLGVVAFRRVQPEQRGIAIAVFAAFQDLAIGATGPVLGLAASVSGTAVVFLFAALAAAAGVVVALRLSASA